MTDELLTAALAAFERAASDTAVRAVVLTGSGQAFCAGGDLGAGPGGGVAAAPTCEGTVGVLRRYMCTSQLLRGMPKVTIAAINGACAGAGLSWAAACDLRYAADQAVFTTAFVNAGLSGDFGGTWTLSRIVGPAKARELYLLGDRFDATEAHRIGFVSKVLPADELMPFVRSVAERLAVAAPQALRRIKENLDDAVDMPFSDLLDREARRHVQRMRTEDAVEAARAFVEKRRPAFRGARPCISRGSHHGGEHGNQALRTGPRAPHRVRRERHRCSHPVHARQPDIVVPLARRHPSRGREWSVHPTGPHRDGRLRQAPEQRPHSYTFAEHRRYLDALLEQLGVNENVTLMGHDWGSALVFDWARRHPDAVAGIVWMEAIVKTDSCVTLLTSLESTQLITETSRLPVHQGPCPELGSQMAGAAGYALLPPVRRH